MKIVRHVAREMRQAMRAIRDRLGDDAVILSSRRVSDGVEVTAAIDFDAESLEGAPVQPLIDAPVSPLLRREAHPARSDSAYNRDTAHARDAAPSRDAALSPRGVGRRDSALAHRDTNRTSRDTAPAARDAALTRRETPPIKDEDEPVHSKLPPALDVLPTYEPTPAAQRFDVAPLPSMPCGVEADSPLISTELQAALLDSLVVRNEDPSRVAPLPAAAQTKRAANTAHSE